MLYPSLRRLMLASFFTLAGVGVLSAFIEVTEADAPRNLANIALQYIAKTTGRPITNLKVVNPDENYYQLQGMNVFEFKVMDTESGELYGITLNSSGQEINSAQLQANEQATYIAQYGKINPGLVEKLKVSPANQPIKVIIWLKEPASATAKTLQPPATDSRTVVTAQQVDAFYAQVDAQRAAIVQSIVAPVANKLRNLDRNIKTDQYTPVIYATLKPEAIRQVAAWDEVDQVYEDGIAQPELNVARSTILANVVHNLGITGSGVRVAQIEVGGRIATANPNLAGVVQDTVSVCSTANAHSTSVAGIIRSTHLTVRGIAPGVLLWAGGACTGQASDLQLRSTAAVNWGARVLNLSWGDPSNTTLTPNGSDKFYDSIVFNNLRTVVKSAGNRGGTDGRVTSPGLGYNVLTVGNFDDKNTISWAGDTMNPSSSWRDPVVGGIQPPFNNVREKPEVAAPGTNITSTTIASPWIGNTGSGTSYAAPMVTGVAALMIKGNNGLATWPQAIKAILMVTAIHNIEGNAKLSEYDGAGGIVADRAYNVARNVSGSWGGRSYTCAEPATLDIGFMSLTGGLRTRAAIVWNQNPAYAFYGNKTSADLDLQVVNTSNQVVALSVSVFNNFEIVDFTPATTGTYKLRVKKFRCDLTPKAIAWAWRKGN